MSWSAIEAALRSTNPLLLEGLRPPASSDALAWLDAAEVPPQWRALWATHDGQTHRIDGLFDGWTFLPVLTGDQSVATVREALRSSGHSGFPVAIDHSGGVLIVQDGVLRATTLNGPSYASADDLLEATARLLRRDPPNLWAQDPDGSWRPSGEVEITVVDPARIPVGEPRQLGHGLVWVRLDTRILGAAWSPTIKFADKSLDLPFAIDSSEDDAQGMVQRVWLRHGDSSSRSVGTASHGGQWWLCAEDGRLDDLELVITLDLERSLDGPRPLSRARLGAPRERAAALHMLGDPAAALKASPPAGAEHAAMLWAVGETEAAYAMVEQRRDPASQELFALWSAERGDPEPLNAWVAERRRARAYWVRAAWRESSGDLAGAVADTRAALDRLTFLEQSSSGRLRALLERRQTEMRRRPRAPAPVTREEDLPQVISTAVVDGADYRARLTCTPEEAARGGTVAVSTPEGPIGLSLPPGAGDGATLRLKHIGPQGNGDLIVTVSLALPEGWTAPEGCVNDTVTFETWHVVITLDPVHAHTPVRVASHDQVHTVHGPAPGSEITVVGAGLPRPRGTPGSLIIRTREEP